MRKNVLTIIVLLSFFATYAQDYFQQEVNYSIDVTLIDTIHSIQGSIAIQYINNSPDELDKIYIHVWGNAFKNRTTAFAKQKIRTFDTKFYFAEESEYGGYNGLDFMVDGKPVEWEFDAEHIDIVLLSLAEPLKPGEEITITTPLNLRIPKSFSRLGHVETSYQMTQWYPKPAVYDQNGWHPMPYLDMGEFYSEFGDYEVSITLPENYVVGATGVLQTYAEKEFLEEKLAYTSEYLRDSLTNHTAFPASSNRTKTISYKAEKVHDFAWFADKRFLVQKEVATLASGETVDCWAFFTDYERKLWEKGAFYTKRAVEFYSERVGAYPYPHATAVQSALSAGAGMEYPMITVIGGSGNAPALDQVITHEVGHNWFYGILGSNERDFAWMDEGINSYHDHKYTDIYYEDFDEFSGVLPSRIQDQMEYSALHYVYLIWSRLGRDQAPNTTSNDLSMVNYFLGAYEKPAIAFKILEQYLGEEEFIRSMQTYYQEWKFKHPKPKDVKRSFEESSGKDLTWLFDGLLFSNKTYDYKLVSAEAENGTIKVENKGEIAVPISVTIYQDSTVIDKVWFEGFTGVKTLPVPFTKNQELEIDRERHSMDLYAGNNDLAAKRPRLKFLTGLKTSSLAKTFIFPMVGYNSADLLQTGLVFHNYGIPLDKFQYFINPSISTRDGDFIGSFEFRRDLPQKEGSLRNISLAFGGKSFHESYNERFDYHLRFTRIQPSIDFEWKKKIVSPVSHYLTYRPIFLVTESAIISREEGFEGKNRHYAFIHDLGYSFIKRSPINAIEWTVNGEFRRYTRGDNQNRYLKIYSALNTRYAYKRAKFFEIRGFAGFFPLHSEKSISTSAAIGNFSLFHRGVNDYRYDHHFINRRGQEGFFTQQITASDGGFKNGISNAMPIGLSNNYMLALNLSADLPFDWTRTIPIKPYFDAGIYSFRPTSSEAFRQEFLWSAGLMLDFQKAFRIHFPLFNADPLSDVYAQTTDNYWQRISFTIDINRLHPHRLKHWFWR